MSKKIAIIESDSAFVQKLRGEFEQKSFTVVDTGDGKAAVDLVKRERPDLIVLSVELSAGQSGYIICGKLKKDDDLKKIPVIIIGKDAEGFESHKRLKARAEEYLKKPFDPPLIVEKIGALIGLPEPVMDDLVLEDESLNLGALGEDEPLVEKLDSETRNDPDLDMLDAAFGDLEEPASTPPPMPEHITGEEPVEAPPEEGLLEEPPEMAEGLGGGEDAEAAVDALHVEEAKGGDDELFLDALEPVDEEKPAPVAEKPSRSSRPRMAAVAPVDDAELASLREKVAELGGKVRELEDQVTEKTNELDAYKSTTGGKDKEYFSLKEQATKKDKEIVRLKGEVNEKDQRIIELEEKQNALEQQTSELTTEVATRDAQIKTLSHRQESAAGERKKFEAAVNQAKDENRQLSAKLSAAQGELDQSQEQQSEMQKQLETARADAASTKTALDALKQEFESVKASGDEAKEKVDSLQAQADKATALEEETEALKKRLAELEESNTKNEQRAVRAYAKIKADDRVREKTKKALAVALQMLEESASGAGEDGVTGEEEAIS